MKPKHTPGPWSLKREDLYPEIGVQNEKMAFNVSLFLYRYNKNGKSTEDHGGEENIANARLIAAAPEMFKIISKAIDLFEQDLSADDYIHEMMKLEKPAKELIYKIQGNEDRRIQ